MDAAAVLGAFPEIRPPWRLAALGNAGGFSGARLWAVTTAQGCYGLRAWPGDRDAAALALPHALMARARQAGLAFVPRLLTTARGATWAEAAGRCWELATWQPGRADFAAHPSRERLGAAATALARVHRAWRPAAPLTGPAEAVARRLAALQAPAPPAGDDLTRRAVAQLRRWAPAAVTELTPWHRRPLPLQPCHCDPWHDHWLFDGDRVTGLIDFGAARERETVAADLARMLGSLIGDDGAAWEAGLAAYQAEAPLGEAEIALARLLDWTGVLVGAVTWLRRSAEGSLRAEHADGARRRLQLLVERLEGRPGWLVLG